MTDMMTHQLLKGVRSSIVAGGVRPSTDVRSATYCSEKSTTL